jgi:hypothetical protein
MYEKTKPVQYSGVLSPEIRANFEALVTHHVGPIAPTEPEDGWIWLDTSTAPIYNLSIYITGGWHWLLYNILSGYPVPGGTAKHTHIQAATSLSWPISHSLNTTSLSVTVQNAAGVLVIPNTVTIVNSGLVTITFLVATAGIATLIG